MYMQVKGKDMRRCNKCGIEQGMENYYKSHSNPLGKSTICKGCTSDYRKSYQSENRHRASIYNVDVDWLNEQLSNGCQICGSHERLVVDHDNTCCPPKIKNRHRSSNSCGGCVRGIICNDCNLSIGHMKDDVERLLKAAEYLRRTKR